MKETKCTYCNCTSTNQPHGDGCHSCLKGIMLIKISKALELMIFLGEFKKLSKGLGK